MGYTSLLFTFTYLLVLRLIPDRCPTPSAALYQFAADGAGPIDQYALICSGL